MQFENARPGNVTNWEQIGSKPASFETLKESLYSLPLSIDAKILTSRVISISMKEINPTYKIETMMGHVTTLYSQNELLSHELKRDIFRWIFSSF